MEHYVLPLRPFLNIFTLYFFYLVKGFQLCFILCYHLFLFFVLPNVNSIFSFTVECRSVLENNGSGAKNGATLVFIYLFDGILCHINIIMTVLTGQSTNINGKSTNINFDKRYCIHTCLTGYI